MRYAEFEELSTERLLLRKLKPSNVELCFARIGSSEDVTRYKDGKSYDADEYVITLEDWNECIKM